MIQDATLADSAEIAVIYNAAVVETTAIWNDIQVDTENREAWMRARQTAGFPVLVAKINDQVAGYASYGPFRPFDGYAQTVEHSVYVATGFQGQGLGRQLLSALIDRAQAQNMHVLVAAIESGNTASIALHKSLGFDITGQMPQVGQKFGKWLDLTLMQRMLDRRDTP